IVPVVVLSAHFYGRWVRRMSTRVQDSLADATSVLEESLSAIRIVQSFVRENYEQLRYRKRIDQALRLAVQRSMASGGFVALIIFVVYGGGGPVVLVRLRLVFLGQDAPPRMGGLLRCLLFCCAGVCGA